MEGASAKGLPRCAAISPGPKGCGLRCPYSPGRLKRFERFSLPLPGASSAFPHVPMPTARGNPSNSTMKPFDDYFSFEAILGDLIRWRVKGKNVGKVLPPRKAWCRAGAKERKGVDPEVVRRQAILRTVMRHRREGTLAEMEWGRNLVSLVEDVRVAVLGGSVVFQKPRMLKIHKGYKDGVQEFRDVASFDKVADRLILNRTTAYVRDVLEGVLGDCCYSFRRDSSGRDVRISSGGREGH